MPRAIIPPHLLARQVPQLIAAAKRDVEGAVEEWGELTGPLSAQADLQSALDGKQVAGSYQPLATVLTDTTAAFTSAQESKLSGISGTNTGDETYTTITTKLADGSGGGTTKFLRADGTFAAPGGGGGSAWGGITGTLSAQIDLNAALAGKADDADITALTGRVNTISNFASPNAGGVVVGQYYDNSFQGTASSTLIGAANRIELAPYYTSVDLPIDRIGCGVSTGVAASTFKIVIYSSGIDGWPNTLLYESGDLSGAAAAFVEATLAFTFNKGTQYWVGVRHSSTCTLRTINVSSAVNLGLTSNNAANYATVLRRTLAFATAATSPWAFTNADRVANITPPSIRFRAA